MKRIFIFSYHGKETFQTSYYRLLSLASFLSKKFEVYFVHGAITNPNQPIQVKGKFREIPLNYNHGFFQSLYTYLLNKKRFSIAKVLLLAYYFFTGREIFDLGIEFEKYVNKTNLSLSAKDVIIVSYPSIAVHNLGVNLKKKFKAKLVLDYRDPGVFGYQHISENKIVSRLRKFFLKRREVRNLNYADLVTTISPSIKSLFPNEFQAKIEVIRNGFLSEKADLNKIIYVNNIYKLVYLGTLYNLQLDDLTFFKAVRNFIDSKNLLPHQFQLKFVGSNSSIKLKQVIKDYRLDPYTLIMPRMDIEMAYTELYDANMFFHLKYANRTEIITSKQYEYLAFQKPILLPVNDFGDIEKSINLNKAGFICNNEKEIEIVLGDAFEKHLSQISNRIERTPKEIYDLSRLSQEEKLLKLIKNI